MKYRYIVLISLLAFIYSCKPELDDFQTSAGNADFTTYVALGNSLTAGYADGSLYRSAQLNSYPSILAQQFQKVGSGEFVQPLLEGEYGILPGKLKLGTSEDCLGNVSAGPIPDQGNLDQILPPLGYTVNNFGVPGAKALHLVVPGLGNPAGLELGLANPYYVRFATSPQASVLTDAIAQNPTFFSLWIGSNDILGYATSGGAGDWISDSDSVAGIIDYMLGELTADGAKGVLANIPDIMGSPFFTVMPSKIPYNGLVLTEQAQVDALNAAYAPLQITFELGQNPFIVEDAITHFPRKMVESDIFLLTLPTDSIQCFGYGSATPIPHKYILDEMETGKVNSAITVYNQKIKGLATLHNLAHVDSYKMMQDLYGGLVYDGVSLNSEFVTGNTFSLDGIHLTQIGYAHVANQFIMAINAKYGATLPTVSLTSYPAVDLP